MKIFKKIAALFAASALALTFAGCNNSQESGSNDNSGSSGNAAFKTVDQIKESGEVTIGVFSDKNPFGYVDNEGKYQGYDVYFAERIAKDLGVELKLVPVEAASRVEFLETAKVDIILANFTVTEERKQKVDFSLPYMKVALGVVSPDSAVIKNAEELNGKTLIVVKGTTAETYFTENYPDVKLQKYDEYNEAYSALQDGRGDAFSTDNTEVLAWAKSNPGFTVGVESLGSTDAIAPAVTKGNDTLLGWLNDEIKALGSEQFFHKDYDETLAAVYGDDEAYKENLVVEGGVM
ncbi:MAG: transporter substrate-binding domain-containing protein [Ruminococcaceae bacterium]|nr:transporter substrate-binding domain-containing protein [Oscillospiraceae bacterium]